MFVYISIGNSDDKLTQVEWAKFIESVDDLVDSLNLDVHGRWYSSPRSPYQNACWCVEFKHEFVSHYNVQARLGRLANRFKQDSIVWAVAETTFIPPMSEKDARELANQYRDDIDWTVPPVPVKPWGKKGMREGTVDDVR